MAETGFKVNEFYFCCACLDCCLFSSTFQITEEGAFPKCPIRDVEPRWIVIEHPYSLNHLGFLMGKAYDAVLKLPKEDTSCVLEPVRNWPEKDYPDGISVVVSDKSCMNCGDPVQSKGDHICVTCKKKLFPDG